MNVLFWGTQGLFSQYVLRGLGQHHRVQGVMVPASPTQAQPVQQYTLPPAADALRMHPDSTTGVAMQLPCPVYMLRTVRHPEIAALLHALAPDLVCVACFPWRIPASLLAIPTFGFVNLHPSLLPAYRGPAPLFWQLRDGLRTTGVTAHWMDADFDTGDIIAQQLFALPDGTSGPEIDRALAVIGVSLIASLLSDLAGGTVPRRPQPPGGTSHSWPQPADFALDPAWSAHHAFNFMRGTAEWQQPYPVPHADNLLTVHTALAYAATARLPQAVVAQTAQVAVQFTPGVLYATPTPTTTQRFPIDMAL